MLRSLFPVTLSISSSCAVAVKLELYLGRVQVPILIFILWLRILNAPSLFWGSSNAVLIFHHLPKCLHLRWSNSLFIDSAKFTAKQIALRVKLTRQEGAPHVLLVISVVVVIELWRKGGRREVNDTSLMTLELVLSHSSGTISDSLALRVLWVRDLGVGQCLQVVLTAILFSSPLLVWLRILLGLLKLIVCIGRKVRLREPCDLGP